MRNIERVAVVGAGAMGALYADHLARAGFEVVLAASGERADRLSEPMVVNGRPLELTVSMAGDGRAAADLVIVAVKHHHLDAALDDVSHLVEGGTVVVSVLNGLGSEELISARFPDAVVPLCIALAMDAVRHGHQVSFERAGRLVLGMPDPAEDHALDPVRAALDRAGLAWETPADMRHEMWWKFMVNVGINQASALIRGGYGAFQRSADARALMDALIGEAIRVAHCQGVELTPADVDRWHTVLAGMPPAGKTSMHQDVEAGRTTEVDIFAGAVVELGERHGIDTPFNQAALWAIRGMGSG